MFFVNHNIFSKIENIKKTSNTIENQNELKKLQIQRYTWLFLALILNVIFIISPFFVMEISSRNWFSGLDQYPIYLIFWYIIAKIISYTHSVNNYIHFVLIDKVVLILTTIILTYLMTL